MDKIILEELAPDINLVLEDKYSYIESLDGFSEDKLCFSDDQLKYATAFGKKINDILPLLYEQGLICIEDKKIIIPYENYTYLYNDTNSQENDYNLENNLPKYSPFYLQINSHRDLGSSDFEYEYDFYWGVKKVFPQRKGCFLVYKSKFYYLENDSYQLIELMDEFNQIPPDKKNKIFNLRKYAKIKELAKKIENVNLDQYFNKENVVVPRKIKLDVIKSENGVSILPKVDGVDEESFKRQYTNLDDVQDVYDTDKDENRVRTIFDDQIKLAVEKLKNDYTDKKVSDIEEELKSPEKIFSDLEGIDQDVIDYEGYGERVKGVGEYAFKAHGEFTSSGIDFLEEINFTELDDDQRTKILEKLKPKLYAKTIDDEDIEIPITSDVLMEIKSAIENDSDTFIVYNQDDEEITIPLNDDIRDFMASSGLLLNGNDNDLIKRKIKKYLIIHDNFDKETYSENNSDKQDEIKLLKYDCPINLADFIYNKKGEKMPLELYDYQKEGVAWLEALYNDKCKKGALLADDMGLGKTLQVLTFLAWLLERKEKKNEKIAPILIVTPPILLQNWFDEISKYFKNNGVVFAPVTILHGDTLKAYKKNGPGQETLTCLASLCVDCENYENHYERGCRLNKNSLENNRIIITNYDTVKNYQFSLAKIKWSAVILDEAQYIKTPDTAVTKAVKALTAEFKLAMTGTPVENKLLDLWSIMDFASPGLLGTKKNFSLTYDINSKKALGERTKRLNSLKEVLKMTNFKGLDKINVLPHIVRREKIDYLADKLPIKHDGKDAIRIECPIPDDMAQIHQALIDEARISTGNKYLMIIQKLTKLYQHISLLQPDIGNLSPEHYLKTSPKLQATLDVLKNIQKREEKVLIFLTSRNMQIILKKVIDSEFGINTDIINGTVSNSISLDKKNQNLRYKILNDFESKKGFNVLILSPHVAGTGLTILEANHVIHYGRWWNPAKESQATDRAYRIGQKKEVFVYYPIYKSEHFETFDQKLDRLIESKRTLAKDFLTPISDLEVTASDILTDYIQEKPSNDIKIKQKNINLSKLSEEEFKNLVYVLAQKAGQNIKALEKRYSSDVDFLIEQNSEQSLVKVFSHEFNEIDINTYIQTIEYYNQNAKNYIYANCNINKELMKFAEANNITIIAKNQIEKLVAKYKISEIDLLSVIYDTTKLDYKFT